MRIKRLNRLWRSHLFVMGVFLVVAAVGLTFFLQYKYFINDSGRTWQFVTERPLVFWYNAYLMLLILLFLTGLTRRPAIATGLLLSVIIAIGYTHINKFVSRGYPLLPEDLLLASEAESMSKMIDMSGLVWTVATIVMVLLLAVIVNVCIGKIFRLKEMREYGPFWKRFAIVPRIALIVVAVALFLGGTEFVRHNSGQKYEEVPWLNSQLVAWNQVRNYDFNGFILGFLYNLQKFQLEAPEGYSEEAISKIRKQYESLAKKENALRTSLADDEVDFVIILNESFMDPTTVEKYYQHTGGDVTPNLRAIQKKYPSGYMYSLDYGGGTANIEFEALTGLSNYWANTVPYTAIVPKVGEIPSVASYFGGMNYATTGIHPFNGSMYKRDIAMKAFGINRLITEREIKYQETEGNSGYINDKSAYMELLDVLGEGKDKNQFVTLVTMQNHLPYPDWIYGEDAEMPFQVSGEWPEDEDRRKEIAVYYKLLNTSDRYLGEFIAELDKSPRKTVVLFFGDHFPGLFPEIHDDEDDIEKQTVAQKTPYFMYSNFDGGFGKKSLPTTTPNCLVNTILNSLGAKKPTLYYLLDEVCSEVPVLTNRYLGEAGYDETSKVMKDYEMVTYDLLGGGKYWVR